MLLALLDGDTHNIYSIAILYVFLVYWIITTTVIMVKHYMNIMWITLVFLTAIFLLTESVGCINNNWVGDNTSFLKYDSAMLLSIRDNMKQQAGINSHNGATIISSIPTSIRCRKRGHKGGVRARMRRRKFRTPLPSIMFGNVRSLCTLDTRNNRVNELQACARYLYEYRESGLICVTEIG